MRTDILSVASACALTKCIAQTYVVDEQFAPQFDGSVMAIAIQPDQKIIVGGSFTNVNGVRRRHLARLNPDGTLDESFSPPEGVFPKEVLSVTVAPGGIYAFSVGALGTRRLALNGAVETNFYYSHTFSSGPTIAVDSDGRVIVGERHYGAWNGVYRFNADASLDRSFQVYVGYYEGVNAVALQHVGNQEMVLAGGSFYQIGTNKYAGLARLDPSGEEDRSFIGAETRPVWSIQVREDGSFYTMTRRSIQRRLPNGVLDATFSVYEPDRSWTDFIHMRVEPRGGVIAFVQAPWRTWLERLQPDGTPDTNVQYLIEHGTVWAMEMSQDGALWVGGSFSNVNCVSRPMLARLVYSETAEPVLCEPTPPKPEPTLTTTRISHRWMVCSWPTNYSEYALYAARRLRPKHPDREKWRAVTNAPVCTDDGCVVTNRIARWGKHYRLFKVR